MFFISKRTKNVLVYKKTCQALIGRGVGVGWGRQSIVLFLINKVIIKIKNPSIFIQNNTFAHLENYFPKFSVKHD